MQKNKRRKDGGWSAMIQSYSDPSVAAFPRLPDLTAVKARWRIRCNRCCQDPLSEAAASRSAPSCGPIQHQLVFEPAAFRAFPPQSPRACSQEDLLPHQMQYYIYTTEQKVLCPSSPQILIVAPFRITECIT